METCFEPIVQFFFEVVLYIVLEGLSEVGIHWVSRKRPPHPALAAVGYAVAAPIIAGVVMVAVGACRRRRDQELIRLDRFAYAYLLALAMAGTRFAFGR